MTNEQLEFAKKKYPFIIDDYNHISLRKSCDYIEITKIFENDLDSLRSLGLENYLKDIKYIFSDIKIERKNKLKKLNDIK